MKAFWIKVVLRDGRGRLVGPVAHQLIRAKTPEEAVQHEFVRYAEDRVWSHLPTYQHGYCRLQTLAVEANVDEVGHE